MAAPSPCSGARLAPTRRSSLAIPRPLALLLAVAVLVGALAPRAAAQFVDSALCAQSCPGAQPLTGTCFQTCLAGCCYSAWAKVPSLTDPSLVADCFNGTCGGIGSRDLGPCQACPNFPAGLAGQAVRSGFCLSGRGPFLCRGGVQTVIFGGLAGLTPTIGNCSAGPCTAAAPALAPAPAPGTATGGMPSGGGGMPSAPPPPPKGGLQARQIWVVFSGFLALLWLPVVL